MDAINREPLEIVASVVDRDRALRGHLHHHPRHGQRPLAFMNRYQADQVGNSTSARRRRPSRCPTSRSTTSLARYPRAAARRGVLTTPSSRALSAPSARASTASCTAFLCRPSSRPRPPAAARQPLQPGETNLARRCGCQHCHASIEPLGAAWGRWGRALDQLPFDPAFPCLRPACCHRWRRDVPALLPHYATSPSKRAAAQPKLAPRPRRIEVARHRRHRRIELQSMPTRPLPACSAARRLRGQRPPTPHDARRRPAWRRPWRGLGSAVPADPGATPAAPDAPGYGPDDPDAQRPLPARCRGGSTRSSSARVARAGWRAGGAAHRADGRVAHRHALF